MSKHISYANITATVALVFAMTGTGFAASHYIITSTSQIKQSVLAKLHGKAAATRATSWPWLGNPRPQRGHGRNRGYGNYGSKGRDWRYRDWCCRG
jgi:uncharacterized membrane protein